MSNQLKAAPHRIGGWFILLGLIGFSMALAQISPGYAETDSNTAATSNKTKQATFSMY
ncbi:MAG: hypothetical protein GTO40_27135 [Deltaproteobacteria bacterium]|nr:hypothetical protein [Deltaproteobacteria bacterium]